MRPAEVSGAGRFFPPSAAWRAKLFARRTTTIQRDRKKGIVGMKLKLLLVAATLLYAGAAVTAQAGTLDDVKKKGFVQCGVNTGLPGFGNPDSSGKYTGFDVDYCRAVSAAIFGDPDKVKYTPLDGTERFPALQSGEID